MLPALDDLLATARVVALPLRTRFRGLDVREAVLIEGPLGWTEFSPFVEYDDAESASWLAAAIDFGWTEPPAPLRDHVLVNATIPAVEAARVAEVLARFPGCRTAKVKVAERGTTLVDDVARVAEVRRLLGPEGRVRIDANAAWNVDEAEHAIHALAAHDPSTWSSHARRWRSSPSCAGGSATWACRSPPTSVRKAEDPLRVARAGAADLLVIKAQPLGGIHRALRITREAGLPVVVSSALDTSVGISMAAHLAAAIPELPHDCGLGTVSLFVEDVVAEPLVPVDGRIPVRRVSPDARLLDAHAVDADRREWWLDRIRRTHAVLAGA